MFNSPRNTFFAQLLVLFIACTCAFTIAFIILLMPRPSVASAPIQPVVSTDKAISTDDPIVDVYIFEDGSCEYRFESGKTQGFRHDDPYNMCEVDE